MCLYQMVNVTAIYISMPTTLNSTFLLLFVEYKIHKFYRRNSNRFHTTSGLKWHSSCLYFAFDQMENSALKSIFILWRNINETIFSPL